MRSLRKRHRDQRSLSQTLDFWFREICIKQIPINQGVAVLFYLRGVPKFENRTMQGSLSLREARANVAEIKDLCLGHVTLRTLRPLLKKIQGHWHTNGVISITRVSLSAC